jgi:hypothetical protein
MATAEGRVATARRRDARHISVLNNDMLIFPENVVITDSKSAYGMIEPLITRCAVDYQSPPYPGLLE